MEDGPNGPTGILIMLGVIFDAATKKTFIRRCKKNSYCAVCSIGIAKKT